MPDFKNKIKIFLKAYLPIVGIVILILLAALLLYFNNITSMQAQPALVAQVYFDGEYRIADGAWKKIVPGEHISSTKGDVTLRGNFHMLTPDGEYIGIYNDDIPIAFYTDHINLTFHEYEQEPTGKETENPIFGVSACHEAWLDYTLTSKSEEPIEIVIHNPHHFGNETAIDELLSNIALWATLAVLSLAGIGITGFVTFKKRKKEDE